MSDIPMYLSPPVPDVPTDALSHPGHIEVTGLVSRPRALSGTEFASLSRTQYIEEFVSKRGDGTVVRRWGGFPLLEVLALAQPLDTARYVRVCAGSYALPVALADAQTALCCDELDGQPLPEQRGAPWRLLLPGADTHTSVKWIDRLEVTEDPGSYDAGCGRPRLPCGRTS